MATGSSWGWGWEVKAMRLGLVRKGWCWYWWLGWQVDGSGVGWLSGIGVGGWLAVLLLLASTGCYWLGLVAVAGWLLCWLALLLVVAGVGCGWGWYCCWLDAWGLMLLAGCAGCCC